MSSRRFESAGYLNAPRVHPPKRAKRRKVAIEIKLTLYEKNQSEFNQWKRVLHKSVLVYVRMIDKLKSTLFRHIIIDDNRVAEN